MNKMLMNYISDLLRNLFFAVVFISPNTILLAGINSLLQETNIKGGLVVQLGCKSDQNISLNSSFLFHGLNTDAGHIENLRKTIKSKNQYGRISASVYNGKKLPYADNMVNLLIVEDAADVTKEEMMRVLAPNGFIARKIKDTWKTEKKARPKGMDEWSHWLRAPDNVTVSKDTIVGPPRRLQWLGNPLWSRSHNDIDVPSSVNIILSANGRVFYDTDVGFPDSHKMPARFYLFARDAFNGMLLWKKPLTEWYKNVEYRRGNPPVVVQRRIVCAGDTLYATFSKEGPVHAIDAATGETIKTFDNTHNAQELVFAEGKLFVVTWKYEDPRKIGYLKYTGNFKTTWYGDKLPKELADNPEKYVKYREQVRTKVVAIEPESGKVLWQRDDTEASLILPQTLAVDEGRVYFKTPEKLQCIDAETGNKIWSADIGIPLADTVKNTKYYLGTKDTRWYDNVHNVSRVMVLKDKVLTVAQGKLYAVSKKDGKILWADVSVSTAFCSPPELFPIGDTVYLSKKGYSSVDLNTGIIDKQGSMKLGPTGMGHHRCYRKLATEKYILSSAAGIELMDVSTGKASYNQWTRGNCFAGFIPANGMLYMTPHPCACFTRTRMNGMLAFAPAASSDEAGKAVVRLEKGPAFGISQELSIQNQNSLDWAMYRKNSDRSGATSVLVSSDLSLAWKTELGRKLSPISSSGDQLFVSAVDEHTVYCLDASSGKINWSFIAGGRVDTPPTIFGDFAVFGCKDGWTYCLKKDNGELIWRFNGAPQQRLVGVFDQLESAWPVHGTVLVLENKNINDEKPVVYLTAGRNTYLDSGIFIYALDLVSGKVVANNLLSGPYREDGSPIIEDSHVISGVNDDILVSDGEYLYIKDIVLDMDLTESKTKGNDHLMTTGISLLDSYWHHRSLWLFDTKVPYSVGQKSGGNLLAFNGPHLFSFRSHSGGRNAGFDPAEDSYLLNRFKLSVLKPDSETANIISPVKVDWRKGKKGDASRETAVWSQKVDIICKAMILTGINNQDPSKEFLFMAGTKNLKTHELVDAALLNKKGGILRVVSAVDGEQLAEYTLTSLPVYDGMAASLSGSLFISQEDGYIICMNKND
jgi:outer membrane protein assembly factor BamB